MLCEKRFSRCHILTFLKPYQEMVVTGNRLSPQKISADFFFGVNIIPGDTKKT